MVASIVADEFWNLNLKYGMMAEEIKKH